VGTGKFNRRRFLIAALLSGPLLALAEAGCVEPKWVKTKWRRLGNGKPTHRFVHFTDVHRKGDRAYFEAVVLG